MTEYGYVVRDGAGGLGETDVQAAVNKQRSTIVSWEPLEWIKAGRVFQALHGELTTPAAFETDLVRQTPDLLVRVPAGVVIVPLYVKIDFEATGAAVAQTLISICNNDPGTSNMTAYTPTNANTRYALNGSKVTAYVTNTGATGTAPTGVFDLWRTYVQVDLDAVTGAANFDQSHYAPFFGRGVPAIVGSTSNVNALLVYAGVGTSSTGYINAAWAEFTYAEFYGS